jgi:DNA-binding NarL/FixJ family response regulator
MLVQPSKLTVKVLCVDDHPLVGDALQASLTAAPDMTLVGRLTSAENVVEHARQSGAEVILMDIEMPGKDPFEAIDDLRRQVPDAKVIMLSAYVRDHYLDAAVSAGAWGYLCKSDDPESILTAIRRVHRGEFVFGREVQQRCNIEHPIDRRHNGERPTSKLQTLTPREQQVLRMIGRGLSRAEIAKEICRSPKTVDAHRASIMEKMDIHDRVDLARYAIREGLVEA